MPLTFETLEPSLLEELTPVDAAPLDSEFPWIAVSHKKPQTMEEANELQVEISDKLELGDEVKVYDKPFTVGTFWHSDGYYNRKAITNLWTPYGKFGGVLYLAQGLEPFGHPLRPTRSEQELLDHIQVLQAASKIGQMVVKVPTAPGLTVVWREIVPVKGVPDTAHAAFGNPGRTIAVTERMRRPTVEA